MPQRQPEPTAFQPDLDLALECDRDHRRKPDTAREAALQRVCDGFTTAISPRSAARLADLLPTATYVQAA